MQKINLIIFEPYPFNRISGNLRTQSNIFKFIDKTKFKLIFLSPFHTGFVDLLNEKNVETIVFKPSDRVNRYGGKNLNENIFYKFKTVIDLFNYNIKLYKLFKQNNIKLVYCNSIRGVLTIWLAALLNKIPILWYIKGELNNKLLDTIGFCVSKKILYFCESNKNDKYPLLRYIFKKKLGILKIGINTDAVEKISKSDNSKLSKELGINKKYINIIYTGQIYPPKGIHYLLEAIILLKKEITNFHLYIVGDHIIEEYRSYQNVLDDIIQNNGIAAHVTFTGWRPDALNTISQMDILVHPSLSEGFGRTVLEGMALGKAVIASKVGGLRELIKNGQNGFLVDAGQPEQIAEKLRLLMASKDLRITLGNEAKKTVYSEYLIKDKIKELEYIWANMLLAG